MTERKGALIEYGKLSMFLNHIARVRKRYEQRLSFYYSVYSIMYRHFRFVRREINSRTRSRYVARILIRLKTREW